MISCVELTLSPASANDPAIILNRVAGFCGVSEDKITEIRTIRRSIDARSKYPKIVLLLDVFIDEIPEIEPAILENFKNITSKTEVIIVGAGPAGYFAAIELIELGIKPIIFERGKNAQDRRRDLKAIQQDGIVNPDSNYCFGEGGAGTYSDGKLYTASNKRGNVRKVLQLLVEHGASPDILCDAHPHIGSNKLPIVVENIRKTILEFGGEINFDSRVTDFVFRDSELVGVEINNAEKRFGSAVILATGHSARDIFDLLRKRGIAIEQKPFALGVRVEHPQELIDEIQYHQKPRDQFLPASSYKLVSQVKGRGVFSFCMCPGGLIVPAATAPGEIVVNGMSMSKRDSEFANSGIVVSVEPEDLKKFSEFEALAGMEFQRSVEQKVFQAGTGSQAAPSQRLTDFVNGKISLNLPKSSYIPGVFSAPVHQLIPQEISTRLQVAFVEFGKKMKGYFTEEANVVAVESRTSSPVKVPRTNDTKQHIQVKNLYPCGEGAGYAGGIMSAAMDGQNVAQAIAERFA